jgi:hypothetical protein
MNITSQKSFQALVEVFSLAVSLRVIGGTHEELIIRQFEQFLPQSTGEDSVPI